MANTRNHHFSNAIITNSPIFPLELFHLHHHPLSDYPFTTKFNVIGSVANG